MTQRGRVVAFALLVALAGVGAVAPAASAAPDTVGVSQNGTCYEVTPYGNGTQTVENFYQYNESGDYSSQGTTHLQRSQESQLLAYNGSNGLSLVVLHDKYQDGDGGGTVTFNLTGVPSGATWVVQDDSYTGQDDNWDTSGTDHHIDWMWSDSRNDGGALRGLAGDFSPFTIDPGFNASAHHHGEWPWSYDASTGENATTNWFLRTSTENTTTLSMTDNVSVSPACAGDPPTAALSAPSEAATGETVTFDASNSSDDYGVAEYRWDVDSDGTVEDTTSNATYTHAYQSAGNYTATVTVVDDAGQTATANTTVEVTEDTSPTARIDGPTSASTGENVTFSGENSSDDGNITSYEWDLGDGTTATGPTVEHAYDSSGTYTVSLTVTDDDGNTATDTLEVSVGSDDTTPPDAHLDAPATAEPGENVTLDASNSSDDSGIAEYRWDLDGNGTVDATTQAATYTHAYDSQGTYSPTVTVVDGAGNTDSANATVEVSPGYSDPPHFSLDVPDTVTVDEKVAYDIDTNEPETFDSIEWEFGDGGTASGMTAWHRYQETGSYSATVTVTDDEGERTTKNFTVDVISKEAAQPSVTIDGPQSGTVGEELTFAAQTDDDGTIVSTDWTFGDGANASGTTVSHSYAEAGEYTVQVTVTDDDGNTASDALNVSVAAQSDDSGGDGSSGDGGSTDDGSSGDGSTDGGTDGGTTSPGGTSPPPSDDGSASDDGSSADDGSDESSSDGGDGSTDDAVVDVTRAPSGAVLLNVSDVPSNHSLTATLPENLTVGAVQFEQVSVDHDGIDRLGLRLNVSRNVSDVAGLEATPVAVVEVSGTGLDQVENVSVLVTVPDSAVENGTLADRSLFVRQDGNWTRLEPAVVNTSAANRTGVLVTTPNVTTVVVAEDRPGQSVPADAVASVSASEPTDDGQVEIVVEVTNDGNGTATYTVPLRLEGEIVDRKQVTVPAGETAAVEFTPAVSESGTYTAEVGGATERFSVSGGATTPTATPTPTVSETAPDTPTDGSGPGFGLLGALVAISVAALLRRRR